MQIAEQRQMHKNEALNKIRKIYNPKVQFSYDQFDDSSCAEQREYAIEGIINELEAKLRQLKE